MSASALARMSFGNAKRTSLLFDDVHDVTLVVDFEGLLRHACERVIKDVAADQGPSVAWMLLGGDVNRVEAWASQWLTALSNRKITLLVSAEPPRAFEGRSPLRPRCTNATTANSEHSWGDKLFAQDSDLDQPRLVLPDNELVTATALLQDMDGIIPFAREKLRATLRAHGLQLKTRNGSIADVARGEQAFGVVSDDPDVLCMRAVEWIPFSSLRYGDRRNRVTASVFFPELVSKWLRISPHELVDVVILNELDQLEAFSEAVKARLGVTACSVNEAASFINDHGGLLYNPALKSMARAQPGVLSLLSQMYKFYGYASEFLKVFSEVYVPPLGAPLPVAQSKQFRKLLDRRGYPDYAIDVLYGRPRVVRSGLVAQLAPQHTSDILAKARVLSYVALGVSQADEIALDRTIAEQVSTSVLVPSLKGLNKYLEMPLEMRTFKEVDHALRISVLHILGLAGRERAQSACRGLGRRNILGMNMRTIAYALVLLMTAELPLPRGTLPSILLTSVILIISDTSTKRFSSARIDPATIDSTRSAAIALYLCCVEEIWNARIIWGEPLASRTNIPTFFCANLVASIWEIVGKKGDDWIEPWRLSKDQVADVIESLGLEEERDAIETWLEVVQTFVDEIALCRPSHHAVRGECIRSDQATGSDNVVNVTPGQTNAIPASQTANTTVTQEQQTVSSFDAENFDAGSSDQTSDVSDPEVLLLQRRMRQLPVYQHRQAIVSAVETNQLTIVQGGTGCGKSTCIPHFLCDAALRAAGVGGRNVRIIVTQPRRLAAIKLATVVAQMRQGDELGGGDGVVGSEVGYVIGKERCATSKTRITFVTTDYMVERLIHHPKSLASITHLVLDEVHERTVGVDMLLLLLRLLLPRHPHVRLVIMSATMEAETLFDYFAKRLFKPLRTRAALCVGSSLFPVQHIHLDQLTTPFPRLAQRCAAVMAKLTKQFDQWLTKHLSANSEQSLSAVLQAHDHQLTVATEVVKDLVLQQRLQTSICILVFLPGVNSIQTLYEALSAAVDAASVPHQVHFHVLHSRVELEDQRKAFEIPSSKYAKIILATNIAESSLTIPDVTHVINCGLERQVASLSHNNSHVEVLTTAWCSQASTAQRAGRAGRVQSGIAYNLFPLDFQQRCMCTYATPEILQKPLSRIVLLLKRSMPMLGTPSALLNASLDPPRHENIDEAFEVLTRHQALDCADEELAKITPFGRFCCHFPLSLELCRLLLVSMNVTRNGSRSSAILLHAVVLVAVLSVPDLFQMPSRFHSDTFIDDMKRSMLAKLSADRALWSEPLTVWRLYIELLASHSSTRRPLLWTWLSKWKLSHARFRTLNNLISDLCDRLIQLKQEDRHGFGQMLSDDTIHLLGKLDRFASTQHADRVLIEALTGEDSKALEDDDVHVMRFLLVATFYENLIEANMNEQGPKPSKKKKGKSKKQTDAMQQRDAENQTNTISLKVVKECTDAFATLKPEERCVLFSSLTRDRLPNNIVVSGDKKDIRVTFPVDPINSAVDSMSLAMIVRPSFPISFACFLSDNSAPIELEIVSAPNSAIKLRFRLEKMNELGVLTWMQPNDPDAKVHVSPRSVFSLPVEHLGNTTHIESFRAVYCDVVRTAGAKRLSALCSRCTLLPVGCAGYYAAVTLLRSKGTVSLLTNKQDGGIQAVYVGERKVELPKNKQLANSVLGCINRLRQGFTDLLCTAVDASVRCEDILELCCDSHVRSHEGSSECFEWQAVDLM